MQKLLRIIQVVNVRWLNATAWYGLSLSRLLRRAGHNVLVLGLSGTESFCAAREMGLEPLALPLNTTNPLHIPSLLHNMVRVLHDFRPHLVNCHRGEGVLFWALLKHAYQPFALVRTRGDQRPPKENLPNRLLYTRFIDSCIVTNSRSAAQCRERFRLGQNRLFLIPGGVDTTRFAPDAAARSAVRSAFGFGPNDLVVGLLGRFDAVKGQKELIEALSRVRSERSTASNTTMAPIRLLLLGFPTSLSQATIEEYLRNHSMTHCTVITGRVKDVAAHINALDLGVIASQGSEAIARAAFEIMACGVPLVGTDVGVMPDLLSSQALVPAGDPESLAHLLRKALSDAAFRTVLQQEQQERMRNCTEQAFLEQTLAAYEAALRRCACSDTFFQDSV